MRAVLRGALCRPWMLPHGLAMTGLLCTVPEGQKPRTNDTKAHVTKLDPNFSLREGKNYPKDSSLHPPLDTRCRAVAKHGFPLPLFPPWVTRSAEAMRSTPKGMRRQRPQSVNETRLVRLTWAADQGSCSNVRTQILG